mgnify:CR=1 FL=1
MFSIIEILLSVKLRLFLVIIMSLEQYLSNPLWIVLVETVHAMVMYPHHKAYAKDVVLHEQPEATPQDLAVKLGIPLGEALVIMYELKAKSNEPTTP